MRLIEAIVPRVELVPDYVVLAAILHHPRIAAPHLSRLHPGDWETDLHQLVSRAALHELRSVGRVHLGRLVATLLDAGTIRAGRFAIELGILARVAELIHATMVRDAVAALVARRRGRTR